MLRESLLQKLMTEQLRESDLGKLAAEIAGHHRDPYSLVEEIVSNFGLAEKNR